MNLENLKEGVMGLFQGKKEEGTKEASVLDSLKNMAADLPIPDDLIEKLKEKFADIIKSGDKDKILEAVKNELGSKVDGSIIEKIMEKLSKYSPRAGRKKKAVPYFRETPFSFVLFLTEFFRL